ncbi:hypothetical protein CRYUN_Cryun29cG0049000 [Craigia yunnanensis]
MEGGAGASLSSRLKRCFIERERRLNMKNLCSHLSSLLHHPYKMSVPQLVDEAREYVKQKQKRIKHLKQTKVQLEEECKAAKILLPRKISLVINIRDSDSTLEVHLVTRPDIKFELRDFLIVLEEEGAKAVSVMYHTVEDRFNCSIISQVYFSSTAITWIPSWSRNG